MNERQKAFCDNYISNGGNATQAAIDAGYSKKTAGVIANENLKKPYIREYLDERMKPTADNRIMTAKEILLQLSATARRENTESVVVVTKKETVSYDSNGRKVIVKTETPEVVQIPAKISDANKAAELLGKYRAIWDGQGKETTSNGILEALQALMEKRK